MVYAGGGGGGVTHHMTGYAPSPKKLLRMGVFFRHPYRQRFSLKKEGGGGFIFHCTLGIPSSRNVRSITQNYHFRVSFSAP